MEPSYFYCVSNSCLSVSLVTFGAYILNSHLHDIFTGI